MLCCYRFLRVRLHKKPSVIISVKAIVWFKDSVFVDAEVNYRKALEANPKSTISMYNLGNTLSQQQKFKDAMEQYVAATSIEKDKAKLGQIYHNMGVFL